jgi:uncharacterized protein (UPF0333 family)
MEHIFISIGLIGIVVIFLAFMLRRKQEIKIELLSLVMAIVFAISGYIYQSGENRKNQDLQYKREAYANLMEKLAIFKIAGRKTDEDMKNLTNIYFRSWAETSDEINQLILKYFKAYEEWTKNKNKETEKKEIQAFEDLTQQIKEEINPKSKVTFVPHYFRLKESNN